MKKRFRVLAAALALCMSLLCCPAALAATDTSTFQTVPYSQATAQPSGQRITIPNAMLSAYISGNLNLSSVSKIKCELGIMEPADGGKPFTIEDITD